MVISKLRLMHDGWHYFNLNVGGFTIRSCRGRPATRSILFPIRYSRSLPSHKHKVIFVYGAQVKRLRKLLESGQARAPRDRTPCILKILRCGVGHEFNERLMRKRDWIVFDFTVRGFTIRGCRWQPETGSIQLPVTFFPIGRRNGHALYIKRFIKKRVVCAHGAHIKRLRKALEMAFPDRIVERAA